MDSREKRKSKRRDKGSNRSKSSEAKNSVPYMPLTEETEESALSDDSKFECTLDDVFLPRASNSIFERVSTPNPTEKNAVSPKARGDFGSSVSPVPGSRKGKLSPGHLDVSPFKDKTNSATKSKSPFSPRRKTKGGPFDDSSSETKPLVDHMEALPVVRSKPKSPFSVDCLDRPSMTDFYEKHSIPEGPEAPDNESTSQSNLSESENITNATETLDIADSSPKTSKRKQRRLKKIVRKSESYQALLNEATNQNSSEESEASKSTKSESNRRKRK